MARKPKALPPVQWLVPRLRLTRALSLACFFGLIALLVVNNLWFANLHGARVGVILAIELVPLLLLLLQLLLWVQEKLTLTRLPFHRSNRNQK